MRSLAEAQISRRSEAKRATAKSFFARPSPRHPSRDSLESYRVSGFGRWFGTFTRFDLAVWVHRSTRRLLVMSESILSAQKQRTRQEDDSEGLTARSVRKETLRGKRRSRSTDQRNVGKLPFETRRDKLRWAARVLKAATPRSDSREKLRRF